MPKSINLKILTLQENNKKSYIFNFFIYNLKIDYKNIFTKLSKTIYFFETSNIIYFYLNFK